MRNIQNNDLKDKELTTLFSITINRVSTSDNEVSNKKYIDDELDKNTIVRVNQTNTTKLNQSICWRW